MKQSLVHESANAELLPLGGVKGTIGIGLLTPMSLGFLRRLMHMMTLRAFCVRPPGCIPNTYPIGKGLRLVMQSIPCTLRRVSSKVPSVCCWTSKVRQRMGLVPVRTFKLFK
jgi:hypothetical protein